MGMGTAVAEPLRWSNREILDFYYFEKVDIFVVRLSDGVIGNTSDFGSEESKFEPWSDNESTPNPSLKLRRGFF